MIQVKVKKLRDDAVIPKKGTPGAACYDLVATEIEMSGDNQATIRFGLSIEVPEGYKVVIVPRSSFTHKGWILANSPAQGDSDFRGEYRIRMEAIPTGISTGKTTGKSYLTYRPLPFGVGDRVAQMFIEKEVPVQILEVEELTETERGEGGFGSTGKQIIV